MSLLKRFSLFRRERETAVCLSSSFFGFFAHAGFLKGLQELGVQPRHMSGASAGAMVAGFYGAGYAPDDMQNFFMSRAVGRIFSEWQTGFRLTGLATNRRGYTGLLSGGKVRKLLYSHLGDAKIEACKQSTVSISVANLTTGRNELKRSGPLADFILASCAMPGLFQAQRVLGHLYWDGGIADPAPFEHFLDEPGVSRIIVHLLDTHEDVRKTTGGFTFAGALARSHEIICDEILRLKLERARQSGREVVLVHTETPRLGPGKLKGGAVNFELGYRSALKHGAILKQ